MDAPSIELEIEQALTRGDRRRAATLMVEHYAGDVLACCRAMLRDRTLAEDLAQETFGKAIAGLETFRAESSTRTWLLSIARNGCLDFMRRRRASPIDSQDDEPDAHASDAPTALDALVSRQNADLALAPLNETERALIVLHYGHGVGYAELAEAFSLREGAVRMRMSRAVDKMKHALAEAPAYGAPPASRGAFRSAPSAAVPARARIAAPQAVVPVLREQVSPHLHARLAALAAAA